MQLHTQQRRNGLDEQPAQGQPLAAATHNALTIEEEDIEHEHKAHGVLLVVPDNTVRP